MKGITKADCRQLCYDILNIVEGEYRGEAKAEAYEFAKKILKKLEGTKIRKKKLESLDDATERKDKAKIKRAVK